MLNLTKGLISAAIILLSAGLCLSAQAATAAQAAQAATAVRALGVERGSIEVPDEVKGVKNNVSEKKPDEQFETE